MGRVVVGMEQRVAQGSSQLFRRVAVWMKMPCAVQREKAHTQKERWEKIMSSALDRLKMKYL